jgi:ubiquinone/menaquinone biosynthesis C-methylase UbiE
METLVMRENVNRWQKAQVREANYYEKETQRLRNESGELWKEYLYQTTLNTDFFTDKLILEVGCGAYGMITYINTGCFKVGIDPLCLRYKDFMKESSAISHLVNGTAEHLPFQDCTFNVVLCLNVLDHVLNPQVSLKEMARVTAPHGYMLFYLCAYYSPRWLRSMLGLINPRHSHHFSIIGLVSAIEDSGFKICRYE